MYTNDSNIIDNLLDSDSITDETPIGWSSTCLDQTLFYYLECNHMNDNRDESKDSLGN